MVSCHGGSAQPPRTSRVLGGIAPLRLRFAIELPTLHVVDAPFARVRGEVALYRMRERTRPSIFVVERQGVLAFLPLLWKRSAQRRPGPIAGSARPSDSSPTGSPHPPAPAATAGRHRAGGPGRCLVRVPSGGSQRNELGGQRTSARAESEVRRAPNKIAHRSQS
jgi:hypothetical protein